ncbi:hypothetical protein [Glaciihabitans sp. UYNi722]|uniref:hypothetical protein n=1 Tax=Glaciihabitans sp. UYNi722 TaxID=3156344 RepID=UPI003392FE35
MRSKVIIVIGAVLIAYVLGTQANGGKKRRGKQPETVRQQAERLWKEPESRKARKNAAKKLGKAARAASKKAAKYTKSLTK